MQIIQYMFITSITPALVYGEDIYAYEGDTVNLTCNLTPADTVTWLVPPNLEQYTVGKSVNAKAFPHLKLIRNENSSLILTIFNFTIHNQGHYRCQTKQDNSDINFYLFAAVNPTNMTISNETTSNKIIAVEGQLCQLICRVASGVPKDILSWFHAGKVKAKGGPGNISYSFIPTRYDVGENFTCIAYRKSAHILLMRNISVSVFFKPNVMVHISPSDNVVEGRSLVISCVHDSNDKDATIRWVPECKEILKTNGQCRFDSVKRTAAGKYTCEVDSKAGTVRNSSTLNILYAPDILINAHSINDSCIYVECIAQGNPDIPVFARWQHESLLGTTIRLLVNSSVLCIQPNSYQDHGLYICNVTNHIPNNDGQIWKQKAYNNKYSGPPHFTERNKRVQYAALWKLNKFYFYVVSGLEIDESNTVTSLPGIDNISISSKDIDDVIYDIDVKVTGYEIIVETLLDDAEDFGNFTIQLTNSAGKTEFEFEAKAAALVYGHDIYAYEGDTVNLTCNLTSKDFVTWLVPPNLQQYAVGKSLNEMAFLDFMLTSNDDSTQILKIFNFTIHNQGQYRCQTKKVCINFNVFPAGPLRAPQNIQAVALDTQIIVKWTDNHDIRLQETFIVEYRKHFESQWSRVSSEDKSTAIIDGLQPGAVYFLRVFSKNAAGESSKSDIIIVKTEKHNSKVLVLTVVLAMILGVMCLMMVMCWCGIQALKNKKRYRRNQDSRGTLSCRNDETFIRPAHYDEIDSMYYNPINSTVSHQAARNNEQNDSRHPLNVPLEDSEPVSMSSRDIHCAVHQFKHSEEDHSIRSSSDESYLVPCRNYIDLEIVKIPENEQQNRGIEETEVNIEKSSTSSNNSETNIKIIRKYETLNVSGINEHCYKKYNDIDESSVLKMDS